MREQKREALVKLREQFEEDKRRIARMRDARRRTIAAGRSACLERLGPEVCAQRSGRAELVRARWRIRMLWWGDQRFFAFVLLSSNAAWMESVKR
eukprot:scaffold58_cov256-Pinguiococcus_pyrenoidosus.AAC.34